MTKLTNEELRQALEEIRMIASGETEPKDGEDAEDALVTIDNICKRMAEGDAGEASPQGDLLAALKAAKILLNHMGDILNGMDAVTPEDEKLATPIFEQINTAIKNAESGSASTAGPRQSQLTTPEWLESMGAVSRIDGETCPVTLALDQLCGLLEDYFVYRGGK